MKTPQDVAASIHRRQIRAQRNQLVKPPTSAKLPRGVRHTAIMAKGTDDKLRKKIDDHAAVQNPHKVPLAQWRKWDGQARRAFNSLYSFMMGDQNMLKHPKAAYVAPVHWKTTAWNAAWTAAEAAMGVYFGDEMGTAESARSETRTAGRSNVKPKSKPPVNPKNKAAAKAKAKK